MSDRNMKDIRNAVEAVRRAAPKYVMKWLGGTVCVHVVSDISESVREEEMWSHTFGSRIPTWS